MKFEVKQVTKEEAKSIIETREPLGLFYFVDGNLCAGIDNRTWDAWIEEFDNIEDCLNWLDEVEVVLCTFPESDDDYCKIFSVPRGWLLDILSRIERMNDRNGVELDDFLQNYVWDETWFIYTRAKNDGKLIREEEQK